MPSSTTAENKSLIKQLIPFDCFVLWVIFSITLPLTILAISNIGGPIIAWLESFMESFKPELLETQFSLPHIPAGVIISSIVGILATITIFVIIQSKYILNWMQNVDKKNLYHSLDFKEASLSLGGWLIYRFFYVLSPIIVMSIISFTLLILSIQFFNFIARMMGVNLELVLTLSIFSGLTVAFFWVCAFFLSVWNLITTVYGSIITSTEAGISYTLARRRSRRFAFHSSSSWGAYIVYIFMIGLFALEFLYLLLNPAFISFKNIHILLFLQLINITIFVSLSRALTFAYYKSLLIQYAKISVKKTSTTAEKINFSGTTPNNFSSSMI
jgi:hypothetical protein